MVTRGLSARISALCPRGRGRQQGISRAAVFEEGISTVEGAECRIVVDACAESDKVLTESLRRNPDWQLGGTIDLPCVDDCLLEAEKDNVADSPSKELLDVVD